MASPSMATLAVAFLLLLNNPGIFAQSVTGNPLTVQNFNTILQSFGASFFETTQPLQPALNSRLRVPSALSKPSIQDAQYYMYFSYAAYCSPESIQNFTCAPCLEVGPGIRVTAFIQDPIFNTRSFVAIDDTKKEIIVAFRGSLNAPNFAEVALLVPGPTTGPSKVRLHQGFYLATKTIYPEVVAAVKNLTGVNPNYAIKVVGHSLGGAEAIIATYLFKVNNEFPSTHAMSLFTYGQPRVGNIDFADYMNSISIPFARVTQAADFAAHFIPALLGYVHTQNELFVNVTAASARYCNTSIYEDPTCSNAFGPLYEALDHFHYFNTSITTCIENDPYSLAVQALVPLQQFIPLIPGSSPYGNLPAFLFPYILTPIQSNNPTLPILG